MPEENKDSEIVVIGAGVAGFSAALELAKSNKVVLIEKNTLGSGSSGNNPGRMGLGFHYVDIETAKMYLRASIEVQRKYPHYLVGGNLPLEHSLRRGRYFITKDSDNSPEVILATYEKIKEEYIRLITEDPENEVFGPPESIFRVLEAHEYENDVNMSNVDMGVETAESLFDLHRFMSDIKEKIQADANISLYENSEVFKIERGKTKRFMVYVKLSTDANDTQKIFHTNYLINSSWYNIDKLNDQIGVPMTSRTNRMKSLLVVKLPDSLKNSNSMFFCMGQHCMFSNLGNGYGMMTYAGVTNMATFHGLTVSNDANSLLNHKATDSEKKKIAQEMLQGVTKYIPKMAEAEIADVKFGIVQTVGILFLEDLKNPNSNFHKRDYYGVQERQIGLIDNAAIKLFHFARNGKLVADLVDIENHATAVISQHMDNIQDENISLIVKKATIGYLEQYLSSAEFFENNNKLSDYPGRDLVSQTMKNKIRVNENFISFFRDKKSKNLEMESYNNETLAIHC